MTWQYINQPLSLVGFCEVFASAFCIFNIKIFNINRYCQQSAILYKQQSTALSPSQIIQTISGQHFPTADWTNSHNLALNIWPLAGLQHPARWDLWLRSCSCLSRASRSRVADPTCTTTVLLLLLAARWLYLLVDLLVDTCTRTSSTCMFIRVRFFLRIAETHDII